MKKTAVIFSAAPLALGLVGAALHSAEISTALDITSGLAERFAPLAICMAAVTILSIIIFFLLTSLVKERKTEAVYHIAFAQKTPACLILSAAACAAMLYAAFLCYKHGVGIRSSDTLTLVLTFFAAASGISFLLLRLTSYLKKSGAETMLCSFVIVLFSCLWLIVCYLEKSAEPAMINYVYDFFALCSLTISGYYAAGYAFGRSRPRATLFFSMLAAFLCISTIPTALTASFRIFLAASALWSLCNVFLLANNLKRENEV